MASASGVASAPGIGRAIVLAAVSLLEDLIPFVVANLLFGLALLLVVPLALASLLGTLGLVLVAVPGAAVMHLASTHVRHGTARLVGLRTVLPQVPMIIGLAAAQILATALLVLDAALGAGFGSLPGALLTGLAAWAGVAGWTIVVVAWPILLDPMRASDPVRQRLRLAIAVVGAAPVKSAALALVVAMLTLAATAAVVVIVVFGWAYVCLFAAHMVLPMADGLEGRPAAEASED